MDINSSTALLKVSTGAYPVYFQQLRQAHPEVSFPENPTEDLLGDYDYAVVYPTARPAGDVVTEGAPQLVNGNYQQTWVVREFTQAEKDSLLATRKQAMFEEILALREKNMVDGFIHETDDARVFGVQIRTDDRINLLGLYSKAHILISQSATTPTKFRSVENESHILSPQQLLSMATAALAAYEAVMQASWDLKDQVETAATLEDLPVLPSSLLP